MVICVTTGIIPATPSVFRVIFVGQRLLGFIWCVYWMLGSQVSQNTAASVETLVANLSCLGHLPVNNAHLFWCGQYISGTKPQSAGLTENNIKDQICH